VEKYGVAREATDDNTIRQGKDKYNNNTDAHSQYSVLIAFPLQQW